MKSTLVICFQQYVTLTAGIKTNLELMKQLNHIVSVFPFVSVKYRIPLTKFELPIYI